ncbi:MAG: ABC transporter permease [Chloroflexota bacterium]|nr:ABC transporter permease [Chloroflexota bacterium]
MQAPLAHLEKPHWLRELIAVWGFTQRDYFLTKRYFWWDLVWLVYTIANALSIGFIGVAAQQSANTTATFTTYLLIGTLIWSYLSMIFDILSETVTWERWEGTIEYTFMSPASRATHLIGTSIYAIIYGVLRMVVMLGVISLFFDLKLSGANYGAALLLLVICSVSLVGFGMVAAVMPLLSPEKGQQVTMIFGAGLLLVSGIYYPIEVLPGWMEAAAKVSPVYYALEGIREAMLQGRAVADLWQYIWPLLIMGAIFPPLGIWVFEQGERFAKRTGRLKRSG